MQALAPPAEDVKIDETLVQKIEQHTEDIISNKLFDMNISNIKK